MTESDISDRNEKWARRIIQKFDSSYKLRWEIFDELISALSGPNRHCLNLGSGIQEDPDFNFIFRAAVDSDILMAIPERRERPFVQNNIYSLPFKDRSFDVIILRFVAEHLQFPNRAFKEIFRVLKHGGHVIILTTNLNSPLILMAKLIPYRLRKYLLKVLYGAHEMDIFPTYHRLNTRIAFSKLQPQFEIEKWLYHQDVNWNRKWLFLLLFLYHLKSKWFGLPGIRTNIISVLQKYSNS